MFKKNEMKTSTRFKIEGNRQHLPKSTFRATFSCYRNTQI